MHKLLLLSLLLPACIATADSDDPTSAAGDGKADHAGASGELAQDGPPQVIATATSQGCGPTAHLFSPDSAALTLTFDYAVATRDETGASTALSCRATAEYRVEPGWRMRLPHLDARGYAEVDPVVDDDGSKLTLHFGASFTDEIASDLDHSFTGWDDFALRAPAAADDTAVSSCDGFVRLELEVSVDPALSKSPVWFQLDSLDTVVAWQRCP